MVRHSLLLVAALGLALAGSVWAQDHMVLRKQVSANPHELVVTPPVHLGALQSERAKASELTIEVIPCAPAPCRSEWRLYGTLTNAGLEQAVMAARATSGDLAPARIVLDSQGGEVLAGLRLAGSVWEQGVDTVVEDDGTCLSACVYILSAGRNRTIGKWALVGVHQLNITRSKLSDVVTGGDHLTSEEGLTSIAHTEILDQIDLGTLEVQQHTGRWIMYLLDSGVSPALVSYATTAKYLRRENKMFVIHHKCARALRLDARANEPGAPLDEVLRNCGAPKWDWEW